MPLWIAPCGKCIKSVYVTAHCLQKPPVWPFQPPFVGAFAGLLLPLLKFTAAAAGGSCTSESFRDADSVQKHPLLYSPSLLLSLALCGAKPTEDWEELWKDEWGNADTRGPLQLSETENTDNAEAINFTTRRLLGTAHTSDFWKNGCEAASALAIPGLIQLTVIIENASRCSSKCTFTCQWWSLKARTGKNNRGASLIQSSDASNSLLTHAVTLENSTENAATPFVCARAPAWACSF